MNTENINYWIQIWDLCDSISEGMDYLSTHFYDERMLDDIITGINTLSSHLTNSTQTFNILNQSKNFLSMFPLQQSPNEQIIQTMETLKNSLRTSACAFVCETK